MGKDQHAVLSQNGFFWEKYSESETSLRKFLCIGILFQAWDTMFCLSFCKISASNRTVIDPVGTALKETREGQHAGYTALLKGQIRTAPNKAHLPKVYCCSVTCLEIKLQPHGSCSIAV